MAQPWLNIFPSERLYAIVDVRSLSGASPIWATEQLLSGGARVLQLRAKGVGSGQFLAWASAIGPMVRDAGGIFIINDRPDIAILSDADGVHLGRNDLPISAARRILGTEKIIGASTHSVKEAIAAASRGADYIAFGPIYPTGTKADAQAPRGTRPLRDIRRLVRVPIVAIGGINETNAREVIASGAHMVAAVSALLSGGDIEAGTRRFKELLEGP